MRTLQGYRSSGCQVRFLLLNILISPKIIRPSPNILKRETSRLTGQCNRFSDEFPNAHFAKLDVDEVPDVAQELGIRAMPTFLIFKDGEKVKEVVGANPQALKLAIEASVV